MVLYIYFTLEGSIYITPECLIIITANIILSGNGCQDIKFSMRGN